MNGAPVLMLSTVALFMCITYRIPQPATWCTVDNEIQVHKIKDNKGCINTSQVFCLVVPKMEEEISGTGAAINSK